MMKYTIEKETVMKDKRSVILTISLSFFLFMNDRYIQIDSFPIPSFMFVTRLKMSTNKPLSSKYMISIFTNKKNIATPDIMLNY